MQSVSLLGKIRFCAVISPYSHEVSGSASKIVSSICYAWSQRQGSGKQWVGHTTLVRIFSVGSGWSQPSLSNDTNPLDFSRALVQGSRIYTGTSLEKERLSSEPVNRFLTAVVQVVWSGFTTKGLWTEKSNTSYIIYIRMLTVLQFFRRFSKASRRM